MADPVNTGGGNSLQALYPSLPRIARINLAPDAPGGEGAGGGGQGGTPPGTAQPEFKAPEGKVLIDVAEHERLRQNNERLRGADEYYRAGQKLGLKSPKDFEPIGKFTSVLRERGLTMDQMIAAFTSEQEEKGAPVEGIDPKALEGMFSKWAKDQGLVKSADLDTREKAVMARLEHQKAMDAERALSEKLTAQLLGDSPTEWEKAATAAMIEAALSKKRGLYPPDHPLHGEAWSPYDEKTATPIFEEIKKLRGLSAGEEMVKAGDAALKGKVSSPAGSSPAKPSKPEIKGGGNEPFSRARMEAAHARKLAARGGKPVSTLGG